MTAQTQALSRLCNSSGDFSDLRFCCAKSQLVLAMEASQLRKASVALKKAFHA